MRSCYYAPTTGNTILRYIAFLPHLALPLGPGSHYQAPISDDNVTQNALSSSATTDDYGVIPTPGISTTDSSLTWYQSLVSTINSTRLERHQPLATASASYEDSVNCVPNQQDSTQQVNTFNEPCLLPSLNASENCDYPQLSTDTGCEPHAQYKSYDSIRGVQPTMYQPLENSSCQPPVPSETVYVDHAERLPLEWDFDVSQPLPSGDKTSSHVLLSRGEDPNIINPPIEKLDWQKELTSIMELVNSLVPDEIEDQCNQTMPLNSGYATPQSRVESSVDSQAHASTNAEAPLARQHLSSNQGVPGQGPVVSDPRLDGGLQYPPIIHHSSLSPSDRASTFRTAQTVESSTVSVYPCQAKRRAKYKRIADSIDTTIPLRRPRIDAADSQGNASSDNPSDESFIHRPNANQPRNQKKNQLPFLTALRSFVQAFVNRNEWGLQPVGHRADYRSYLRLLMAPEHKVFKESMLKFHQALSSLRLLQQYFGIGMDFYMPTLKRVEHWSSVAIYEEDSNIKTLEKSQFRSDSSEIRLKLKDTIDGLSFFYLYDLTPKGHNLVDDALSLRPPDETAKAMAEGLQKILLAVQPMSGNPQFYKEQMDMKPLVLSCLIYSIVCKNLNFGNTGYWGGRSVSEEVAGLISSKVKECLINQASIQMANEDVEKLKKAYERSHFASSFKNESSEEKTSFYFQRIAALLRDQGRRTSLVFPSSKLGNLPLQFMKAIKESQDNLVIEWRKEIKETCKSMQKLVTARQGHLSKWSLWEQDLALILVRYKAYLEATQSPALAQSVYQLFGKRRSRFKEFAAGLRFMAHASSFPKELEALKLLLTKVVVLIEASDGTQVNCLFGSTPLSEIQKGLSSQAAQEVLLSSLFYTILSKSLNINTLDEYDYSILQEADIKAVRMQAEKYLNNLQQNLRTSEDDLVLAPSEQAQLCARLLSTRTTFISSVPSHDQMLS